MTHDVLLSTDSAPQTSAPPSSLRIAPTWHTLAVVAVLIAWASQGRGRAHVDELGPHSAIYLTMIMMEVMLLGATVSGIFDRGLFFFNTLGRDARSWGTEFGRAIGLYGVTLLAMLLIIGPLYFTPLRGRFESHVQQAIAPQHAATLLVWLLVSFSAGFCEEHVFRGYLLQQCLGYARAAKLPRVLGATLSVLLTSLLFGSLHLYQGIVGAIAVTLLGVIYALAAMRFRNLRAVVVAHTLQDALAGTMLYLHHLHKS
jgi:membrane protease YdiL (CAAX protease family)